MSLILLKTTHGKSEGGEAFNLQTKMRILEVLEQGKSEVTKLSKFFRVPESYIEMIQRNKKSIRELALALPKDNQVDANLMNMEALLLSWVDHQNEKQVTLSNGAVRQKAIELYNSLTKDSPVRVKTFSGSVDWLNQFKKRYDSIANFKIGGHEAFSVRRQVANARLATLFVYDLNSYIEMENYRPEQIFCVRETKLCWKKIPGSTFEPAVDRMTVALCSNMSGTMRCKPAAVLKMEEFTNLHPNDCECCTLPVNWFSQGTTWMNLKVFHEWYERMFIPEVKNYCENTGIPFRILLLLDRTMSHQDLNKTPEISVMYFPRNTDSMINPLNCGVIPEFLLGYLQKTLESLLEVLDTKFHSSLDEVWKNFGKNDAIDLIGQTWNGLGENTMKDAWACLSGEVEGAVQSRETNRGDQIKLCLQLYEQLVGEVQGSISESDIQDLLESHNKEISNDELADLYDIVPSDIYERYEKRRSLRKNLIALSGIKTEIRSVIKKEKIELSESNDGIAISRYTYANDDDDDDDEKTGTIISVDTDEIKSSEGKSIADGTLHIYPSAKTISDIGMVAVSDEDSDFLPTCDIMLPSEMNDGDFEILRTEKHRKQYQKGKRINEENVNQCIGVVGRSRKKERGNNMKYENSRKEHICMFQIEPIDLGDDIKISSNCEDRHVHDNGGLKLTCSDCIKQESGVAECINADEFQLSDAGSGEGMKSEPPDTKKRRMDSMDEYVAVPGTLELGWMNGTDLNTESQYESKVEELVGEKAFHVKEEPGCGIEEGEVKIEAEAEDRIYFKSEFNKEVKIEEE